MKIVSFNDTEDGGAIVTVEIDAEDLLPFAVLGIKYAWEKAVQDVREEPDDDE